MKTLPRAVLQLEVQSTDSHSYTQLVIAIGFSLLQLIAQGDNIDEKMI